MICAIGMPSACEKSRSVTPDSTVTGPVGGATSRGCLGCGRPGGRRAAGAGPAPGRPPPPSMTTRRFRFPGPPPPLGLIGLPPGNPASSMSSSVEPREPGLDADGSAQRSVEAAMRASRARSRRAGGTCRRPGPGPAPAARTPLAPRGSAGAPPAAPSGRSPRRSGSGQPSSPTPSTSWPPRACTCRIGTPSSRVVLDADRASAPPDSSVSSVAVDRRVARAGRELLRGSGSPNSAASSVTASGSAASASASSSGSDSSTIGFASSSGSCSASSWWAGDAAVLRAGKRRVRAALAVREDRRAAAREVALLAARRRRRPPRPPAGRTRCR